MGFNKIHKKIYTELNCDRSFDRTRYQKANGYMGCAGLPLY